MNTEVDEIINLMRATNIQTVRKRLERMIKRRDSVKSETVKQLASSQIESLKSLFSPVS